MTPEEWAKEISIVWKLGSGPYGDIIVAIEAAVTKAYEECAKIAEAECNELGTSCNYTALAIAKTIRARKP